MNTLRVHQEVDGSLSTSPRECEISVVIPAYRSEATLDLLLERLLPALDKLRRSYEVVLVEDGSPDGSWTKIESLQRKYPERVVAVQLMRNFGQHNALMCGFRHARGGLVVTMDDDLQNPPEEIERLIAEVERSDCDLVYGNYAEKKHASFRNLGSFVVNSFYRSVFRTNVTVTSFRAIRRPLLQSILHYDRHYIFLDGLLAWNTQRIGSVLVEHHARQQGRSTYSFGKLLALAVNLFTSFSLLPLQLVSALGAAAALSGFCAALIFVARAMLFGGAIPGNASTIVLVLTFGGVQLLALGVMGEYLGRILLSINGKPQYCERQVLDSVLSTKTGRSN